MTDQKKNQLQTLLITIVSSLIAAGGGSFVVNNDVIERLHAAESKILVFESERTALQKDINEISDGIDELTAKVEEGQKYIRDKVVADLTTLQTDVAVLKSRR